jgi:hypothetical protein
MILAVKDKRFRNPRKIQRVLDRYPRTHLVVTGSQEIGDIADRLGFRVSHTRPLVTRRPAWVVAFWEGHPVEPLGCAYPGSCDIDHDLVEEETGKRPIEFIDPMRKLLDQAFRYDLNIEVVYPSTRV